MEPFGAGWAHLGSYGTIWGHMGSSGTISAHLGPYGTIWAHLRPYGTIWDHMRPYDVMGLGLPGASWGFRKSGGEVGGGGEQATVLSRR